MNKTVSLTVKTTRTLLLPTVPNYLRTESDNPVDITTLTEDQLREIGTAWTAALIKRARDRRCAAARKLNRVLG